MIGLTKENPATLQLNLSEKLLANLHPANKILSRLKKQFDFRSEELCGYSRMHNRHNRS